MSTKEEVIKALKEVIDPHTGTSLYDMNLISDLKVEGDRVSLTFTPSSPYCPLGIELARTLKQKVENLEVVSSCEVTVEGHVQKDQINKELKG